MLVAAERRGDLDRWLQPYLADLSHSARGAMCPLYVAGLIGLCDRKSVQPIAARSDGVPYDRLHHFIAAGIWDEAPLQQTLLVQADRLVGGSDAILVVDDTALPTKSNRSIGVAPQYATTLGKTANVALFLPET
jgi:SRSO17 transposase